MRIEIVQPSAALQGQCNLSAGAQRLRTPAETPRENLSAPDIRCSSWWGGTKVAARESPSPSSAFGGPGVGFIMRAAMGIATGTDVPCGGIAMCMRNVVGANARGEARFLIARYNSDQTAGPRAADAMERAPLM